MLDMYADEINMQNAAYQNSNYQSKYFSGEPTKIKSMKDIPGW